MIRTKAQPVVVSLTPSEIANWAGVGMRRQMVNLVVGRKDAHGFNGDGWGVHVEGAMAEGAAAKGTDRYYAGRVDRPGPGDVGHVEVRRSDSETDRLIVYPSDPEDRPYIHVTGRCPGPWSLWGWITGAEAKAHPLVVLTPGRPPCHAIGHDDLHPMDTLPR